MPVQYGHILNRSVNPNVSGIIAIILWSISPLLIIGAGETPPLLLGFLALSIGSITLFSKHLLLDKISYKTLINQPAKAYFLTTYGIGGYICFWLLAFKHAPAFEANTLNYLWPILLVGLSMLFKQEAFSFLKIFGLLLGFLGIGILFTQKSDLVIDTNYTIGYIYAIIAAFIWATYSVLTRSIHFKNSAMATFMIAPALLCLLLHLLFEKNYTPSAEEFLFIFLLGLTRISFSFWDFAMKKGKISFIASLSYFIPIISTILLIYFGFVPRNEIILLSTVLVLSGCLIINKNIFIKKTK